MLFDIFMSEDNLRTDTNLSTDFGMVMMVVMSSFDMPLEQYFSTSSVVQKHCIQERDHYSLHLPCVSIFSSIIATAESY